MGWDDLDDTSGVGFHLKTHMLHGAGIFTNIYPINHPNVGKYTSTMEHMGNALTLQVIIRDWARLGMAGDEKGTGESYEKARPKRAPSRVQFGY